MAIVDCDIHREFAAEAALWKKETSHLSSVRAICSHPSYRRIIAMSERIIPDILRAFLDDPDHWHLALKEITGADPVPKKDYGRLDAMARHWFDWGKERGLV